MAEKMKMNKQLEAPLLPVPTAEDDPVFFVCLWGLLNAGVVAVSFAAGYFLSVYTNICDLLPLELQLTDKKVAKANALMLGYFLCGVAQAATGILALLLAGHRRRTRRALAYVVLAATVAGHGTLAGASAIYLTAGVGNFFTITAFVSMFGYAMDDLDFFLVLMGSKE